MPKKFAIRLTEIEVTVIREALTGYQPCSGDEDAARDGLLECLPGGED